MENFLLRKEVSTLLKESNNIDNLTTAMNLSEEFIQENLMKSFHYDERKYVEYLGEVKKSSSRKWNSLGEKQLTKIFPCFTILLEQYNEKIYSKRSKQERERERERDLIKEGFVEGKSIVETKGRIVTSAGQFYLLLQKIIVTSDNVSSENGSGESRTNGDGGDGNVLANTIVRTNDSDGVRLEDLFDNFDSFYFDNLFGYFQKTILN